MSITGDVDIIIGLPFALTVSLSANASVATAKGKVEAFSDIGHTLLWNGVTSMKDADGNDIGYSVQSLSGTDWSQPYAAPVPEPSTWIMFAAGLALLGLSRQHRSTDSPGSRVPCGAATTGHFSRHQGA